MRTRPQLDLDLNDLPFSTLDLNEPEITTIDADKPAGLPRGYRWFEPRGRANAQAQPVYYRAPLSALTQPNAPMLFNPIWIPLWILYRLKAPGERES